MGCSETRSPPVLSNLLLDFTAGEVNKTFEVSATTSKETIIDVVSITYCRCIEVDNFDELLMLTLDSTPNKGHSAFPRWATRPTTVASAAFAYLNRRLRDPFIKLNSECVSSLFSSLLSAITSDELALRQHSIYFASKLLEKPSFSQVKQAFNENNAIGCMIPQLVTLNSKFRSTLFGLCAVLYKDSRQTKEMFFTKNGIALLFNHLLTGRPFEEHFLRVVMCLNWLITDSNGDLIRVYAREIIQFLSPNVFYKIRMDRLTDREREIFDELTLSLLQTMEQTDN